MNTHPNRITRRQFLADSTLGMGALTAAGSAVFSEALQGSPGTAPNPFALNTEGLRETDPKLVSHAETSRFPGMFPEARRICVGGDRLYIAAGNVVSVLDLSGEKQREMRFAEPVRCAAAAGEGLVYIGLKNQVEVRDAKGATVERWEALGDKAWLSGMVVGANELYVADSGSRLILRYDRSGKLLGRIGGKNQERGVPGIILPSPYLQVALGKDGLLRVNNSGRHRVELYTPEGDLELHWGVAGGGIAGFCGCCNPIGLAVLPDGKCITCEKGAPRVKIYEPDGAFVSVVAGAELFPNNARSGAARRADGLLGGLDAAVGADGRVYVLDLVSGEVRVMTRKTGATKA